MLFCLLGGNISKLDRGRLEKIVKKAGHVVGKPLDSFKTLHENRLYRKLMQILNDSTHPVRHYFDSRVLLQQEWKVFTSENKYKPL